MNWYARVVRNYLGFRGRARRSEFWWFTVSDWLLAIVLSGIDAMTGLMHGVVIDLGGIYFLALFLPRLAVKMRRLHDSDRSGWWVLLLYSPIVVMFFLMAVVSLELPDNLDADERWAIDWFPLVLVLWAVTTIWFYVLMFWRGTVGPNRYGPDPRSRADAQVEADNIWSDID